jgi:flagellar hook-associated protein 3 FlgL
MITSVSTRAVFEADRQSRLARAVTQTQIQISTGKRLQRASEDPVSASRIEALGHARADQQVWAANLDRGLAANAEAGTALSALQETLVAAKTLFLSGINGTAAARDVETVAQQLDAMAASVTQISVQRMPNGAPLFRSGAVNQVRMSATVTLAPVPSRDDAFSVSGEDMAQIMRTAAAALRSGMRGSMESAADGLDRAVNAATDSIAKVGLIGQQMEALRETSFAQAIELDAERSALEDTDISEAIARLNTQSLTLQAAQAAFARLSRTSLFDLLS